MQGLKMLGLLACLLPGLALAADNTTQIQLHGTLIEPPPCTINGGAPIVVTFGDNVGTSRVDGTNYTQPVDYSIRCEGNTDDNPWVLGLTVIGVSTSFDGAAIQTAIDGSSSTDLGIRLRLDGKDFTINQRQEIKYPLPPMEATPVQKPGATLPEGFFHATATLLADYE